MINWTDNLKERFKNDLRKASGNCRIVQFNTFHDGWSVWFNNEVAALRVAVAYANTKNQTSVKLGTDGNWGCVLRQSK